VPIESSDFRARWAPEEGSLAAHVRAALGAELGQLEVQADGTHAPTPENAIDAIMDGTFRIAFFADDLALSLAAIVSDGALPPLEGRLSGSVLADGRVDHFSLAVSLDGRAVVVEDVGPLDLTLDATYDEGAAKARIEVSDMHGALGAAWGEGRIDLPALVHAPADRRGELLAEGSWEAGVRLVQRRLDRLPLPVPVDIATPLLASARVTARHGRGQPLEAAMRVDLQWPGATAPAEQAALYGCPEVPGRLALRGRLSGGVAEATVRGFSDGKPVLEGRAAAPLPVERWLEGAPVEPPPVDFLVEVLGADLGQLPLVCEHASGPLFATVEVTGLLGDQPSARIQARSPGLVLAGAPALPLRLEGEAGPRDASLELRLGDRGAQQRSRVTARVPIAWDREHPAPTLREDEPLRAELEMRMAPIGPWLAPVPGIGYPTGLIDGRVVAEGVGEDIQLSGALELHEVGFSLLAAGNRLENMSGLVRFDGQTVRLERFEARDDGGVLSASGELAMRGFRPQTASLAVVARRFPIRTAGRTMGNASLKAKVDVNLGETEGEVRARLDRMTVSLATLTVPQLQSLEPHREVIVVGPGARRYAPETPGETLTDDAYVLVLHIKTPTPFWVRRPDMAAQLEANLRVRVADATTIAGRVTIVRGFFELMGRRFVLRRGHVEFTGAEEVNPLVELTATHDLGGGRRLTMTMTGDLQQPQLRFATEDREVETLGEAIALLLGTRQADSATHADVESQAASVLSGITAGILTTTLRRELGDLFPVISVDAGGPAGVGAVRAGLTADRLIPRFMRGIVTSAYMEGFVTTADRATPAAEGAGSRAGVLVEFRYPKNLASTVRLEPPQNWSLDLLWEP
jgi:hypothetical protein